MNHSWQMYPLGLLFGLGFDTASEVGLLAMTAGASAGDLPIGAVLSLPILFAAGMSVMDTTDGVLMSKAYNWAFLNPLRKIFYNITTTSLSIAVALVIGTIELLQVFIHLLGTAGAAMYDVGRRELDFGVARLFHRRACSCSAGRCRWSLWKFGHLEAALRDVADFARAMAAAHVHAHEHTHASRQRHSHHVTSPLT